PFGTRRQRQMCIRDSSEADERSLNEHVSDCSECAAELTFQKQLMNALEAGLGSEEEIELPENFTKVIIAASENDVGRLRRRSEISNAVMIIGAALIGLAGLAFLSGSVTFGSVALLFEKLAAVTVAAAHLIYSFAVGIAVILRSLTGGGGTTGSWFFVGAAALAGLVVLIAYFRPKRSENA
ncbi:MAG: hypothetical protein QUS14_16230, partial [Pyrinomonadaceae bacterium]|nr:hypothetical protein [Pyrinomonadaceae bacterium]